MRDIVYDLVIVAVVLAAGVGIGIWSSKTPTAPVGVAVEARPAEAIKDVPTETVSPPKVTVLKPLAKKRLALPPAVQDNPQQAVTGAVGIKADWHPRVVSSVLDVNTGETRMFETRQPLPLLAIDTSGEAGVLYGLKGGQRAARLEVRQSLFDIKAVKVGVTASYDQPIGGGRGDGFVGVGAWYRW